MDYLRYSSNEMFSSTNLIRQSKQIFDKLNTNEIEKAVILRDGKPSFIMLEFEFYEKMIAEYIFLKENSLRKNEKLKQISTQNIEQITIQNDIPIKEPSLEKLEDKSASLLNGLEVVLEDDYKEEHTGEIKDFWNK